MADEYSQVSEVFFNYGEFSLHTPSDLSSSRLSSAGNSVIAISLILNVIATGISTIAALVFSFLLIAASILPQP